MTRISWDEYFLKIAEGVKLRSTCFRRQVGAVVVDEKYRIVATGFNGVPREALHCETCIKDDEGIESGEGNTLCPAVHAEMNALQQAGKEAEGCTLYITDEPCKICERLIKNTMIKAVVISKNSAPPSEG